VLLALPIAATTQVVFEQLYVKDRIEEVRAVDAATARRRWWRARRAVGPAPTGDDLADREEGARVG
jgi:hypothetical protein